MILEKHWYLFVSCKSIILCGLQNTFFSNVLQNFINASSTHSSNNYVTNLDCICSLTKLRILHWHLGLIYLCLHQSHNLIECQQIQWVLQSQPMLIILFENATTLNILLLVCKDSWYILNKWTVCIALFCRFSLH